MKGHFDNGSTAFSPADKAARRHPQRAAELLKSPYTDHQAFLMTSCAYSVGIAMVTFNQPFWIGMLPGSRWA